MFDRAADHTQRPRAVLHRISQGQGEGFGGAGGEADVFWLRPDQGRDFAPRAFDPPARASASGVRAVGICKADSLHLNQKVSDPGIEGRGRMMVKIDRVVHRSPRKIMARVYSAGR